MNNPDTGNQILASTVTSTSTGSNCLAGSTDPRCTTTVTVSALTISSAFSPATATPGTTINETTTITNTGQTPYCGISVSFTTSSTAAQSAAPGTRPPAPAPCRSALPGRSGPGTSRSAATVTITGSVIIASPYTGSQVIAITDRHHRGRQQLPGRQRRLALHGTANVLIPGLTITQVPSTTSAVPGQAISYTLTITNTGQTTYTSAVVTDSFVRDARRRRLQRQRVGHLRDGDLRQPGADLDRGPGPRPRRGHHLHRHRQQPRYRRQAGHHHRHLGRAGSSCPPGTTTSPCQRHRRRSDPRPDHHQRRHPATATPGATVTYTLTAADTGQTPYTGATVTDPLTGVLDDAAYNHDAATTTATTTGTAAGAVTYTAAGPDLDREPSPGDTATITFSVTVTSPDAGNHLLASTLTSAAAGHNCPAGGTDPRCTTTVPVSDLVIDFTASASTVTPGGTLVYTATITNAGQTPYYGISVAPTPPPWPPT